MAKKDKKTAAQDKPSFSEDVVKKFKQNPGIYIGSVVILVLVIVTFLGGDLLSGGLGRDTPDFTFGEYDKIPIAWVPGNIFSDYHERISRNYQAQGIDPNDFRASAQIWRSAFEQMVVHTAVLQLVKKSNYAVPEKSVDRAVAQQPQFQDNGRFSPSLYNRMSEKARLALWQQTRDELAKMMFFDDFFAISVPKGEADFISRMASPLRSFEMVSFSVDEFPESEYLNFARENAELFNSIHLSKITVTASEREAKKILAAVRDGSTTFEDAARIQSQDIYADRGGDMGVRYLFDLESEIPNSKDRDIIVNLSRGELSDVIKIGDEWAFFRVEGSQITADFDDFMVMDRVRSYVRNFARGRMEDWGIEQARDFISDAQESGFDNAARWRNKEKRSFGPLPINYGGVDLFTSLESFQIPGFTMQDIQDMSRNESFWEVAFSAQLNVPSKPLVQGNNVLVFLPVEEIISEEDSMEYISMMYSSYWLNYITEQSLQKYFLDSEKMDDRFWDAYFRFVMP